MAGLCGYAGEHQGDINFEIDLTWTGQEFENAFADEWLRVSQVDHTDDVSEQPIELRTGEKVWIWGDIYGHQRDGAYTSRSESGLSRLEFVERVLGPDWRDSVPGLNGSFLLLVYDPTERALHFVTDKILSRPLFYTSTSEGLVFSPRIQSLYLETDLSPTLDQERLQAFFSGSRSGIYTPLQDTHLCHPGSILTYDIPAGDLSIDTYWRPDHDPVDKSAEWFTTEFIRRLEAAVDDRIGDGRDISLMLSGGGDSRLLAAIFESLGVEYRAYHSTSWESSYETTITRAVAEQLGTDLTVLKRDSTHYEELLGEPMRMYNFQGWYEQAHFEPHMNEVNPETDLLFTGEFADGLFKGDYLPRRQTSTRIDNIHRVELGSFDLKEFLRYKQSWASTPYYYTGDCQPLSATIHQNVYQDGDDVVNNGITLGSAKDLLLSHGFYPATNLAPYFRQSLLENTRLRTPYMDDRLINLYLKMPAEFVFENNVLNMALSTINPELSVIANASTAFPPVVSKKYHRSTNFGFPQALEEINLPEPPEDWQGHDAWGYNMHNEELRHRVIRNRRETIEAAPFLDDRLLEQADGRKPWGGDKRYHGQQYRELLSFVCSPLAEQLV